ncbi:MAG TPA: anti-sigma factor [Burkholderiales bacterium]|nr:anti-sigma factor [Burkholderiales bacterium]
MKQITDSDLHAFVDARLSASDRASVEAYLADHAEDAERVKTWREQASALRALYDPILEEPVPPELAAVPHRPAWHRYAVAASFFLVGIATGWGAKATFAPGVQTPLSLPRQAAIAHVVYAPEVRHPVEVPASDEEHLVRWLSKRVGKDLKAPHLGPLGYDLVGGRLLSGPQGPVAHFMYQDARGQRLTLYVSRTRGEPRDTAFRYSQEDRVSVFYWVDGNFGYALSGEIGREQLLKIADVVYKQLNP